MPGFQVMTERFPRVVTVVGVDILLGVHKGQSHPADLCSPQKSFAGHTIEHELVIAGDVRVVALDEELVLVALLVDDPNARRPVAVNGIGNFVLEKVVGEVAECHCFKAPDGKDKSITLEQFLKW